MSGFQKKYFYLIKIQYLGYRFHGWQKQPDLKTLHLMVDKTLRFVFDGKPFKTLASGRTDAMVSALDAAIELFVEEKLEDEDEFLNGFNYNLPQDIRALSITKVDKRFNIINQSKQKEYLYVFAFGNKFHPFCAPIMTTFLDDLDIEIMKQGAKLFEGHHNFKSYCFRPTDNGEYLRRVDLCEIVENTQLTASFFPETSYIFRIVGKGFMRNQIRLMVGALVLLGKGEVTLEFIERTLKMDSDIKLEYIAPPSGLILNKVDFEI